MGAQTTHIEQASQEQPLGHKANDNPHINIRREDMNKDYHFQVRKNELLQELKVFKYNQQLQFKCEQRQRILSNKIDQCHANCENNQFSENNLPETTKQYFESQIFPILSRHQLTCFACTGKHWQFQQWKQYNKYELQVQQEANNYKQYSFRIENPDDKSDYLEVFIYKYLKSGDGFLREDKVRNMKIYKKPLSEMQLTNLIFQHQYLVVECDKSYWSFEKDTKRLIIQSSVLLSDVRDKVLGKARIEEMGFKWFGLRNKWFPQVMYESNRFTVKDIGEVRLRAQHSEQSSLKYNVFKANCKVYAQYIMKNSIEESAWKEIQTFFDFFHT